jgi:hypothetical protein
MNIRAFEFESGQKKVLIGGMILGVICLVATFLQDDQYHTGFWSSWVHNSVFFTGIAFTSGFFLCGLIVGFGGWMTPIRRVWEAMSLFMLVSLALLSVVVIGLWGHLHHLYHWNALGIIDPASPNYDKIIAGKAPFLNPVWFTICSIGFVAAWYFLAKKIRDISLSQDESETVDFKKYKKSRNWAAWYLPTAGFLSPLFFWQLTMSIDPHWYSTMFAWYSMVSTWLASLSLTMLILIYLKSKGYMDYVTKEHLHDVGKFMFGISIFWTYLWFDQFMLIWYANNGEETIYFKERMEHYPVLFWGNLLLNFVAPFLILMRNDNKRKFGTLFIAACIIFFGHWWDFFYMIKPGARTAAFEAQHAEGHGDAHTGAANLQDHGGHSTETHAIESKAEATVAKVTEAAHADHSTDSIGHTADGHTDHATQEHKTEAKSTDSNDHAVEVAQAATTAGGAHTEDQAHPEAHGDGHAVVPAPHGGNPGPKEFKVGYTIPGFLDIGTMIGFLSLFLFMFFRQLSRASLLPKNDPFLEESLYYSTGAHVDEEIEAAGGADHH